MDWTLLHKYLSGECTPEEKERVEGWLHTDERNLRFLDSLEKIWDVEPGDEMKVDARSAWNSFQQKIPDKQRGFQQKASINKIRKLRPKPSVHKRHSRTIAIFLSAAAVILFSFLFSWYVPVADDAYGEQSRFTMQEIVTTKGQRTTFRLSDGTRVQLNADSKIEIPGEFMDSTRRVYLEGEAYFEVARNLEKPFLVYTENAHTRVLGTKFGVRAYPEEDQIQVVVTEGKVSLSASEQPTRRTNREITSNQMGILSKNGSEAGVFQTSNIQQYLGWKDGKLVFEDTQFREVRSQLERWFDITCIVADSTLDERQITASFNGEPMTEVLNVVALSMDMSYEREGRRITFKK